MNDDVVKLCDMVIATYETDAMPPPEFYSQMISLAWRIKTGVTPRANDSIEDVMQSIANAGAGGITKSDLVRRHRAMKAKVLTKIVNGLVLNGRIAETKSPRAKGPAASVFVCRESKAPTPESNRCVLVQLPDGGPWVVRHWTPTKGWMNTSTGTTSKPEAEAVMAGIVKSLAALEQDGILDYRAKSRAKHPHP